MADGILFEIFRTYGYIGIMFLLVFIAILPVPILPEDVVVLLSGYLSREGILQPTPSLLAILVGVYIGDGYLFFMGYFFRNRLFKMYPFRIFLHPDRMQKIERFYQSFHVFSLLVARFVFGIRAQIYIAAGILRMPPMKFFLLNFFLCIFHLPLIFLIGYTAHGYVKVLVEGIERWEKILAYLLPILLLIGLFIWGVKKWIERF